MAALSDGELRVLLSDLEGWTHVGHAIHKEFRFPGFRGSIAFVNRVADAANAAGHHPDIEIHYQRVMISLSTHDQGGVTDKDLSLARDIDRAVEADDA
jgi:4a-hydroxytetrahydrobiopterin dehydratase